jgi:hypothetical protein
VHHRPVIPERYSAWRPFPASSEIICLEEVLTKEGKDVV